MRHYFLFIVLLAVFFIVQAKVQEESEASSNRDPGKKTDASIDASYNGRTLNFLNREQDDSLSPVDIARAYLEAHRLEWNLQPYHDFQPIEFKSPLNTKVKYHVYQEGIPILDMGISIEIRKDRTVGNVENTYIPIERVKIEEKETKIAKLIPFISERYTTTEDPNVLTPPVIVILPGTKTPQIAYQLSVTDKARKSAVVDILFRATDGQVLGKTRPRSEF